MEKENLINASIGEFNGRITRSRASGVCASRNIPPIKSPMHVDQKLASRVNPKRRAMDDISSYMCPQRKKRAVLQDVSNVGRESSYKDSCNETKIQPNSLKQKQTRTAASQTRKAPYNMLNECTSAAISTAQLQAEPKTEMIQERFMGGGTEIEENVPSQLCVTNGQVKDIDMLKKRTIGQPLQPHNPSKKEGKGGLFGTSVESSNPYVIDIDSDKSNPLLCSLYVSDFYINLHVVELFRRPCCDFMETVQRDITQGMRGILVDWLVEVSEEYKLVPDTLYLTVYLIDSFLARNYIERQKLQLLGITCMLIASRFLRAAQASYKSTSDELEYLANYLSELTMMDYGFLSFVPSVIAASAVFLARWTLDRCSHPWNPTLEHYTTYKASDLQPAVHLLQDIQLNTSGCPLNAIRMKYRQEKFKSVAALSSTKLLQTLF